MCVFAKKVARGQIDIRYGCLCKWSNTQADWRLDVRLFVNVVTRAHIDRWICVYVNDVTRVHIDGWICVYVYEVTRVEIDG